MSKRLSESIEAYIGEKSKVQSTEACSKWLEKASERAKQIQIATHVLKFIHPETKGGSNVYEISKNQEAKEMGLLSSASMSRIETDFVGNAAVLDVAKLLLLEDGEKRLIDFIELGDMSPLAPFALDENQLERWRKNFLKVFTRAKASSHSLAKQVYFPVEEGYHLLAPLYATSLAHRIWESIQHSRYSEKAKQARKARKEKKYSADLVVYYEKTAQQKFGGSKPQNISYLNSKRGGKMVLLNSQPPSWKRVSNPPLRVDTIFSKNGFERRVWNEIKELKSFLKDKYRLDGSPESERSERGLRIESIIDQFFQYSSEIWEFDSGWSTQAECKLCFEQQLWLDPLRCETDEAFRKEFEKQDWQEKIASSFARWLNRVLETKKLRFSDDEHLRWFRVLEVRLHRFKDYAKDFR